MTFRVWAPRAESVLLHRDGGDDLPMQREDGGWFTSDADAPQGCRYGFRLDGGGPLADPRSRFQPDGPEGLSEVFDPTGIAWTDGEWQPPSRADLVIYEVHVGTFSAEGTFDGVIPHLASLRELGVTALEVMPVAEFPGSRGWGYDGVDLFAAHHAYGGPAGLARLVDAAHSAGLAVFLDVVYNHVGPEGNVLDAYGPYFTDRYVTPWGRSLNVDGPGSPEVRRFVVDNAVQWVRDFHIDGLRLDAAHSIVDVSAIPIHEELAAAVHAVGESDGKPRLVIAEWDRNDPRIIEPLGRGGWGLDAHWNDEFHHAVHALVTGERDGYYADFGAIDDLRRALQEVYVYAGRYSSHRDRVHGRALDASVSGDRFVCFVQNHDQAGNRAAGDRIAAIAGPAAQRAAAALLLLSPYIPLLFMGEEWASVQPFLYVADHRGEELREQVRKGRIEEFSAFGWNPEEIPDPFADETWQAMVLDRTAMEGPEAVRTREWYRELLRLRRELDLGAGARDVHFEERDGVIRVTRRGIRADINAAGSEAMVAISGEVHLASDARVTETGAWELMPWGTVISRV